MPTSPIKVASGQETESVPKKEPTNAAPAPARIPLREVTTKPKAAKDSPKPHPKSQASARPTKILPTDRITFTRQLDILRAWAAISGPTGKIATNNAVADVVKMQPSTVSMGNAFLSSTGLLMKADGGYIPNQDVQAFLRNYEWAPEMAAQKLAPTLAKSWFANALLNQLAFGPMAEKDAIQKLADEATAGPEYRNQLRVLLDYLAAAGLIQREGDMVRKGGATMPATSPATVEAPSSKADVPQDFPRSGAPALFGTTEGKVQFNVSVSVNMSEFATWEPERIAAFFNGIAQVLAAKANV